MTVFLERWDILSQILKEMAETAKVGVTTMELNNIAEKRIEQWGYSSYNKGYKPDWAPTPFPCVSCISVNDEMAHGIPSDYKLQEGDMVNIDLGIMDGNGDCADAALSFGIGEISNRNRHLLKYAKRILYEAIDQVRDGVNTYEITQAIVQACARYNFRAQKRFAGHTIGKKMHMPPRIYNTEEPQNAYDVLHEGQIICIEPVVTESRDNLGYSTDGWAFKTNDGKPSAYFEHMVRVTKDGAEVLTTHISQDH